MEKSFFRHVLTVSAFIVLLTCIGLRQKVKEYRVATKGIHVNTKINKLYVKRYFARWGRGYNFYADFVGDGVHMERVVSDEFYFTHHVNDEVEMKYLPDEDVILYGFESRGDAFIVRGIFVVFAIVILILARRQDLEIKKKRIQKEKRAERDRKGK